MVMRVGMVFWVVMIRTAQAAANWEKGRSELERYGKSWEAVNINDCVPPFYDESLVVVQGRKMFFPTADRSIVIVADFGGGYLRFMDKNTGNYVDKDGNYVDPKSKDFNSKTHYRILKREEM